MGGASNGAVYFDARNGTFGTDSSRAHNFGSAFANWGLVTGFSDDGLAPVPEPATLTLLAPGLGGLETPPAELAAPSRFRASATQA